MFKRELRRLIEDAHNNETLRQAIAEAKNHSDPMKSFCDVCRENGYEIYLGELFSYGQDMNDSKLRATNGGGSFAIDGWDDAFENILDEILG